MLTIPGEFLDVGEQHDYAEVFVEVVERALHVVTEEAAEEDSPDPCSTLTSAGESIVTRVSSLPSARTRPSVMRRRYLLMNSSS